NQPYPYAIPKSLFGDGSRLSMKAQFVLLTIRSGSSVADGTRPRAPPFPGSAGRWNRVEREADKTGAHAPKSGRRRGVVGCLVRGFRFALGEIPTSDPFDLSGGGEVDRGSRTIGGSCQERAHERLHHLEEGGLVLCAGVGAGHAGVQHGRGDRGPCSPPG